MNLLSEFDYHKLKSEFNDEKKPYKYVIIDNFFKEDIANKLFDIYPSDDSKKWYKFRNKIGDIKNVLEQGMYGISDIKHIPQFWNDIIFQLNSSEFCKVLEINC